jgi:hypothetical protein
MGRIDQLRLYSSIPRVDGGAPDRDCVAQVGEAGDVGEVPPGVRGCQEMPLAGGFFFVIPGWSAGPGPECRASWLGLCIIAILYQVNPDLSIRALVLGPQVDAPVDRVLEILVRPLEGSTLAAYLSQLSCAFAGRSIRSAGPVRYAVQTCHPKSLLICVRSSGYASLSRRISTNVVVNGANRR